MTNRVMRSCKCNGVADLLKQAPLPYVLSYMVTMGLYRTVSEINCDFSENRKFFPTTPRLFNATAERVPLGTWYRRLGSNC